MESGCEMPVEIRGFESVALLFLAQNQSQKIREVYFLLDAFLLRQPRFCDRWLLLPAWQTILVEEFLGATVAILSSKICLSKLRLNERTGYYFWVFEVIFSTIYLTIRIWLFQMVYFLR